ncbi:MucR family transcriptional regulator [Gluconobacter cerinus]|uniref:MucR family transcriptional regulator n=1 Tax=Gluconobacter cerinus TaxID=38307 RepID=UPI001B8C44EC|nr:MucR family transcriptional regulator [Gluconobacter cerinus]MBS1035877.1 MucR family transcriptional regulator [Gluconobacter cerinus]MBS1042160.1 MucR family transcriptional regulator [Gluconobacter cerinus]MBS1048730.1 MucR family transcriptional regulator [Gluconobacter cerinus]
MTDLIETIAHPHADLLPLTADIVAAYLSQNELSADQLPALIRSVHDALATPSTPETVAEEAPTPAVNPKRSVFPDYIICLEDGKKLKMLRRHLKTAYNMTPEEYRARWGLPREYPMVAPSYSEQRSSLAREIGLGSTTRATSAPASAPQEEERPPVKKLPEKRRGRPARA